MSTRVFSMKSYARVIENSINRLRSRRHGEPRRAPLRRHRASLVVPPPIVVDGPDRDLGPDEFYDDAVPRGRVQRRLRLVLEDPDVHLLQVPPDHEVPREGVRYRATSPSSRLPGGARPA